MKNKTSMDCEGYNNYLIEIINPAVCSYLARLFNCCFEEQHFPRALKFVRVKPLLKSGEKDNCGNYRPIFLLPVISKVLENLNCSKMKTFVAPQKNLTPNQLAYQSKNSTIVAILDVTEINSKKLPAKDDVACTFIGLSKAFDSVDRSIFLEIFFDVASDTKFMDVWSHIL